MKLTRENLKAAFDCGVEAFLKSLNKSLEETQPDTQQSLLPAVTKEDNSVQKLIGYYVILFKRVYGEKARPDLGGRSQAVLKRILKDHGEVNAGKILRAYLGMKDPWFTQKCHDLVTLEIQLQKVLVQATAGPVAQTGLQQAAAQAGVAFSEEL